MSPDGADPGWSGLNSSPADVSSKLQRVSLRTSDCLAINLSHPGTFLSAKQILRRKRGNLGRAAVNILFLRHGTRSEIMTIDHRPLCSGAGHG